MDPFVTMEDFAAAQASTSPPPPSYDVSVFDNRENQFAAPAVRGGLDPSTQTYFKLLSMNIRVEVHMAMAFVTIEGTWRNPLATDVNCVFEMPLNAKATATSCRVVAGDRIFETLVISKEEADSYIENNDQIQDIDANYFYLPFQDVKEQEIVSVSCTYFESLIFWDGSYRVKIPLKFRPESLPEIPLHQALSLSCSINVSSSNAQWGNSSHKLICQEQSGSHIKLLSDPEHLWQNQDFDISYSLWHDQILCSAINQAPPTTSPGELQRGNFCLCLTPPHLGTYPLFGRRIVFILDKSGSMLGEAMDNARDALKYGLSNLTASDFFTVIAFSEHQYYYSQALVPATAENMAAAIEWVYSIQAAGLTDILTPLKAAVDILNLTHDHPATKGTVPFVFLITDGAVDNEKDICAYVVGLQSPIRFNTFGIGQHANHVFLKALAQIGKGFCEISWRSTDVFRQMVYLLGMTNAPVLTEVKIGIGKTAENIDIFPYPIPDLFCGCPLIISGKYTGVFPSSISVFGLLSNGEKFKANVEVNNDSQIPIEKIFVKQQLDLLTAKAWMVDSRKIKQQVIDLSCSESMPCAHTRMIAFEIPEKEKSTWDRTKLKNKRFRRNLLIGIGGVVVLGLAAAAFGDVFASMGGIGGGVGGIGGGAGGGAPNNCNNCNCTGGDCGGDCGDCGDCDGGGDCGGGGGGDCGGGGGGDCGDCGGGGGCDGCDCGGCDCSC